VADGVPSGDLPMYRELWKHIAAKRPKKGKGKAGKLDPLALPTQLLTALKVLYGHYQEVFELWQKAGSPREVHVALSVGSVAVMLSSSRHIGNKILTAGMVDYGGDVSVM
jgi:hypothetical protein